MKDKVQSYLSSGKDKKTREQAQTDNLFKPDYIDFDEFGHVQVRCMRCGTPIVSRTELPTKDPGVKVLGMKKLASYQEVSRGIGKAPILCSQQCKPILQVGRTPEDEDRIDSVQMSGWVSGMVWAGKGDEHIKDFIKRQGGKE